MRNARMFCFSMAALVFFVVMATAAPATAQEFEHLTREQFELLSSGGLLYDKWFEVLDVDVHGTHPSYPGEGGKSGKSTWRCKECHGWDYKGKDGAYSEGSHYTGIKGITDYTGKAPEDIVTVLRNDTHAFGDKIPGEAYKALSYFVAYGQVDMDKYIDRSTRKVKGDPHKGARIYTSTCAKCHGAEGKKINFKSEENPQYVGTLANKNPWETLHKVRYGQPSEEMPNLLFLDTEDQIDVLAYCQTLPLK